MPISSERTGSPRTSTTKSFTNKEALVQFVSDRIGSSKHDSRLIMTIYQGKFGGWSATTATDD